MIPTVSLPSLTSGALTAPKLLLTPLPALVASLLPSPGTTLHALPDLPHVYQRYGRE